MEGEAYIRKLKSSSTYAIIDMKVHSSRYTEISRYETAYMLNISMHSTIIISLKFMGMYYIKYICTYKH